MDVRRTTLKRWRCRGRNLYETLEVLEHRHLFLYRDEPCWHYLDRQAAPVAFLHGSPRQAGWLLRRLGQALPWDDPHKARRLLPGLLKEFRMFRFWGMTSVAREGRGWIWRFPVIRIGFGQQPCGFFPKRFLWAKIKTARRLQNRLGGELIFFYHDSDHDHRETRTILVDQKTGEPVSLNFQIQEVTEKRFTPLYCKPIAPGWQEDTLRRLARFVSTELCERFASVQADNPADFCLEMYRQQGLLQGVQVVRSSNVEVRLRACEVDDFFADLPYRGHIVRARQSPEGFFLHHGGECSEPVGSPPFHKSQVSPTRDTRLVWMQSVLGLTHYVAGASEMEYLNQKETPEITFIPRDSIAHPGMAYLG